MDSKKYNVSSVFISWYQQKKRDLPWRNTSDPYRIWISEIILQQTRVAQGYDYYLRFVDRFPDVVSLASADEGEVLKYWQGLGYYSRARNLYSAAKSIVSAFGGVFPRKYEEVLSLKGVGNYTAAAIVSFAYDQPYAVLDGNVFRVLARLFAIEDPIDSGKGKKLFASLAQKLLDEQHAALHNQAVMEFGALQCVPVNPDCTSCPLDDRCLAFEKGLVGKLPYKQGKTKVQNRYFNCLDIRSGNNSLFLQKRTADDIWKNLYELPLVESAQPLTLEELLSSDEFCEIVPEHLIGKVKAQPVEFKHVLSHRIIYAKFYQIQLVEGASLSSSYLEVTSDQLEEYAISRLVSRYFDALNV